MPRRTRTADRMGRRLDRIIRPVPAAGQAQRRSMKEGKQQLGWPAPSGSAVASRPSNLPQPTQFDGARHRVGSRDELSPRADSHEGREIAAVGKPWLSRAESPSKPDDRPSPPDSTRPPSTIDDSGETITIKDDKQADE